MEKLIDNKIEDEELLNDVKLLNVICNDLNNCIKDQGTKLNNIVDNLTKSEYIVNKASIELESANDYKRDIRKKYLTLAGIGGILIYLLIL
jgi:t-SNARE complex subunit (syntaxin)